MDLAGQRDRRQRRGSDHVQPALPGPEREGQEHRDPAEQVAGAGLHRAVGRERERQPTDERSADPEAERAQPQKGKGARPEVSEQEKRVPAADGAEAGVKRPEDRAERPACEVDARLCLRPEAVGVAPRNVALTQLVSGEPELPDGLQVIAGSGGPGKAAKALRHEVVVGVLQRRPG